MSTRLLLDGDDLPALMRHVRDEFGPDARIVKAERVRTGGVAGFFTKERYELTIEVSADEEGATPRKVSPARPVAARPASGGAGAGAGAGAGPGAGAAGTAKAPIGIDALIEAAEAADGGGPAEGFTGTVGQPAGAAAVLGGAKSPPVSTASQTFADVLLQMRQMVREEAADPADLVVDRPGAPAQGVAAAVYSQLPVTGSRTASPEPVVVPPAEPQTSGADVSAMLALGLPAELLRGFADLGAAVPLSVLTRRIRTAPALSSSPGSVVAVVGDADQALAAATVFAGRLGLETREVVLAGTIEAVAGHGRRLLTASAVARHRARLAPGEVTVVAIGAGFEPAELAEAADMLAALEPTQAWAVVDARVRRIESVRRLAAIGAQHPVDAIVATGVLDAQAPASVLGLGLPVGWIGGVPAGSVAWAAVLGERLAEDARWD